MGLSLLNLRSAALLAGTSVVGGFSTNAFAYMNFFKQAASITAGTSAWPGSLSADGYPTSTPGTAITGNFAVPAEYFGRYRLQFDGTGSIQLNPLTIVYSGGVFVANVTPSNTGSIAFSLQLSNQTNPRTEIAFGALISTVADNGSGVVRLTSTLSNAFINLSAGTVQINNIANLTGTWAFTRISNNQIDLTGSAFSASMVPAGGGPGPQAEAIVSLSQVTFTFLASGTYSGMANLILCRKADIDGTNPFGLQNGYQCNADLVAQIKQLNPKYLRLMDASAVINNTQTNFTYRPKTTIFSFLSPQWQPDYWVGAITNGGSDAYTCSNPVASGVGAYADGEIFQGQISGANTGTLPTINLNGRGASPLYDKFISLQNLKVTGAPTTGDIVSLVFTGSYISGSPHTLNYTVKSTDTTNNILQVSLQAAINADTTLSTAGITSGNASDGSLGDIGIFYNFNAGSGSGTTFSASVSGAATEIITLGRYTGGALANNALVTFTYSALLGGWLLSTANGLNAGMPVETMCEICNRANVGLWANIPLLYTGASVTAMAGLIRDMLNATLPATFEVSNEVWNFGQQQTNHAQNLGLGLGLSTASLRAIYGFYALRVRQFMELVAAAWTTTRSRSQLNCTLQWQESGTPGINGITDLYRLQGADLTTTNAFYAAKGGLGGGAGTTYTAVGNRPVDFCDSCGYATYWFGTCFGQGASEWTGSIANFANALQAGADYASGNPTSMANALAAVFSDVVHGTLGVGHASTQYIDTHLTKSANWFTVISNYDAARAGLGKSPLNAVLYEGANQVSFASGVQGYTTSPANLAAQFTNNGWDTSPYGASNTIVAQQLINLWFAFLNSSSDTIGGYGAIDALYTGLIVQNPGRKVSPAQYQYDGPGLWALFPGDIYTSHYETYDYIAAFNAVAH